MNNNFIQYEGHIIPKPEGLDCALVAGKVYRLIEDRRTDELYLEEDKDFEFPEKYFLNKKDEKFMKKAINTYKNTSKLTTGVLLSGMKGSGKTLMMKKLATMSELPIIVVDSNVSTTEIEPFFAKVTENVCVCFDEIDKYWSTRYLLGFLDGVKPTCKKLVLCTANDEKEIDEYLNDRCSRIRYKKSFNALDKAAVVGVLEEVLGDKTKAKAAAEFAMANLRVISYDNIIIFGEEIKNNPDETLDEIVEDLNIEKR